MVRRFFAPSRRGRKPRRFLSYGRRARYEPLEERTLLEVNALLDGANNVVITGSPVADAVTIKVLDQGQPTARLQISDEVGTTAGTGFTQDDAHTISIAVSDVSGAHVTVNTLAGDDRLTQYTSVFAAGLQVAYDGGADNDGLAVIGTGTESATYTPSAGTAGNGTIAIGGANIAFTSLSPIDISGMMNATVSPAGGADLLTVQEGFDFATGTIPALRVSGTTGGTAIETVALWNNTTVTIDTTAVDGDDTITVASGANDHQNQNLVINTGTGIGDAIAVNGDVSVAGDINFSIISFLSISLGATLTAGNRVTLSAGGLGSIVDSAGTIVPKISAQEAVLGAAGGIGNADPIDTQVFRLDVTNTLGNLVRISNSDPLELTDLNADGFAVSAAAGVQITASSPITITNNVTVGGASTFAATDTADPGDDLTIADGVTIQGNGNPLTFDAGDNFLLSGGATITDAGVVVTVNGDFGDADPGVGTAMNLNGTVNAAQIILNGKNDNDTFTVKPSVNTPINVNGFAPVVGDPGVPPGDRLILSTAGISDIVVPPVPPANGVITFAAASHKIITFTSIESLIAISADRFETPVSNDTIASATNLGSLPEVTLRDLTIAPAGDVDFFRYTAHESGKLIVRAIFDVTIGDLSLEIFDHLGNAMLVSQGHGDNEELVFPVVGQQVYFIEVFGPGGAVNNYSLEVENFPAPVPRAPILNPLDDNGISPIDNITSVQNPRITIQADLDEFESLQSFPPQILTSAQATAGQSSGAAVEVFANGVSQGFADLIPGTGNTLFSFQLSSLNLQNGTPIAGGVLNLITAAVRVFDGVLDPPVTGKSASGRTQLSEPLALRSVDTQGASIKNIIVTGAGTYDLFGVKSSVTTPTPLVKSLTVSFSPSYDVLSNVVAPYEDISATGTALTFSSTDDAAVQVPVGFSFPFFDGTFTDVFVATNGLLTFGSGNTTFTNADLNVAGNAPAQPSIAPFWDDWDVTPPGHVFTQVLGTAGVDRRLVVQWQAVHHHAFLGAGVVDFEAVLFENGTIDFRYKDVTIGQPTIDFGASATVGIRDAEPTAVADGKVHQISFNQAAIQAGRTIRFTSPFDPASATNVNNYRLVGDANGNVLISSATVIAPNKVQLNFAKPLPDDRFTLTILDTLHDLAGNALDGESQAAAPGGAIFPSGNGVPGGNFVARFTVDSRPEIGAWGAGQVLTDINGNFSFDLNNVDFTNRDLAFAAGFASDYVFAGNFVQAPTAAANGFDKLGIYGRVGNQFRWYIDFNGDGVLDVSFPEPAAVNGIPVAGNFDGNKANGDEVGLFTGTAWFLDTNHDFQVDSTVPVAAVAGVSPGPYPVVGDFNGDGFDDLATYDPSPGHNTFSIALFDPVAGGWAATPSFIFRVGLPGDFFGFDAVAERPVAADMNHDGVDDLGLMIPALQGQLNQWYFLLSGTPVDDPATPEVEGSITYRVGHAPVGPDGIPFVAFDISPFGNDLYAQFGERGTLPIVGNFDPPAGGAAAAPSSSVTAAPAAKVTAPTTTVYPSIAARIAARVVRPTPLRSATVASLSTASIGPVLVAATTTHPVAATISVAHPAPLAQTTAAATNQTPPSTSTVVSAANSLATTAPRQASIAAPVVQSAVVSVSPTPTTVQPVVARITPSTADAAIASLFDRRKVYLRSLRGFGR